MNIIYKGASDDTNNKRFAIVQHNPSEEPKADRFAMFAETYGYKVFGEEEMIYIEVSDREDYDYVKDAFKNYKKLLKSLPKVPEWHSYEHLYGKAKTDEQMYLWLLNETENEKAIKNIMYRVSGATDAYNNAIDCVSATLF